MSIIKNLQGKKIAILGLGIENLALVRYILKHKIKCEITICDARNDIKTKMKKFWIPAYAGMTKMRLLRSLTLPRNDIKWQLGKEYNKNLEKFDVLFRSPGWPIIPLAPFIKGVSSAMKLFFEMCPSKNIIGVTGTKGKGTTASLTYEIIKSAGKRVWLGGNIGVAPFEFMDKIKKTDWVVLELSSFQLEDMTVSPHIAVITNFYSEHLAPADPNNPNYHHSLREYQQAKANIFMWQKASDYLISNDKFPPPSQGEAGQAISKKIPNSKFQVKSKIIYFNKSDLPSKLIGEHNKENVAAAVEVAKIVGVKPEIIKKAVAGFKGLEHRLELARELNGVKYYNDSFATTPEATIMALKSFVAPIVLLLGGADKEANFKKLATAVKSHAKYVVLLKGDATLRIKKELLQAGYEKNKMKYVSNIKEAVAMARGQADRGDVVLLSTACASFGMFKNYKARGKLFKAIVKSLKQ